MTKEYKVVTAKVGGADPERAALGLTMEVQESIQAGWSPVGGVAVVPRSDGFSLFLLQSMVKD